MRRALHRANLLAGLLAGASALCCAARADTTLIRITPEEYRHSIHDIFGASVRIPDNQVEPGFREEGLLALGTRKLTISSAGLERYESVAEEIASQVVDPRRRAALLNCKPRSEDAPDNNCAAQFIARAGLLLFRRPLLNTEIQTYVATQADAALKVHSFNAGLAAALVQMLVDPNFLFRVERRGPDRAAQLEPHLDAYSMASRLSFFLWDSGPDSELLTAARTGSLQNARGLQQQVDRLLESPRVESGLRAFIADMFGFDAFATLSVDTHLYPKFTRNVQEDAQEQTLRTIVDQLLVQNADYRDLFVSRDTFLTPALAALYDVPLARSQELGGAVPWVRYRFAADSPYIGILSQVSFLSLNSHPGRTSPTLRGKALRENILCQKVPSPPGNVDFGLVQDTNNPLYKTVRARLTAHRKDALCAGCHKIMDPIGLSLETFDTAAEFRTTENGAPIDTTGDISGQKFDGVVQLAHIVRDSPATSSCLITRAFSYGTQRKPTEQERAWLASLQASLTQSGLKWRELMRRLTLSPNFYTVPSQSPPLPAQVQREMATTKN
jgi:hypothetical protein